MYFIVYETRRAGCEALKENMIIKEHPFKWLMGANEESEELKYGTYYVLLNYKRISIFNYFKYRDLIG
jgi:hypothetical protein